MVVRDRTQTGTKLTFHVPELQQRPSVGGGGCAIPAEFLIEQTLRELTQAYPKETDLFLKKNLTKISATAFAAAVEKLPKDRKEQFKKIRKEDRKGNLTK